MKQKLTKAQKLEALGDKLVKKKNFKSALKKYRKALEHEPDDTSLMDKLITTRDKLPDEWELDDFVESLSWTMKKQEIERPGIRHVHAKLSPEWKGIMDEAVRLITAPDDQTLPVIIDKFLAHGETGTRVLIEVIREILRPAAKNEKKE